MWLRITGGEMRGRRIRWTPNPHCRPTLDRVREAVMAIIEPRLDGANFLDLFAGSGIVGIEALSRGASRVTFVDLHGPALANIERQLDSFSVDHKRAETIRADARSYLKRSTREKSKFDIIYADPPYASELGRICLEYLSAHAFPTFGLYVWERETNDDVEPEGPLTLERVQRIGSNRIEHWAAGETKRPR